MSASLVGSEMCIRDRTRARIPPSRAAHLAGAFRSMALQEARGAGYSTGCCLLYTSDAADDM
eukprot:11786802-Alexandrium_andersonii.AAC.1